jgi:hypothetical protein
MNQLWQVQLWKVYKKQIQKKIEFTSRLVFRNNNILCDLCKKTKKKSHEYIVMLKHQNLSFYMGHKNVIFFPKTCMRKKFLKKKTCMRKKNFRMYMRFFLKNLTLWMCFKIIGSYAPGSRIWFLVERGVIEKAEIHFVRKHRISTYTCDFFQFMDILNYILMYFTQ